MRVLVSVSGQRWRARRRDAWPARPGRARSPGESPAWPGETRSWWLRQSPGGRTRRVTVRGCRPPGLPAVVPQARDPAARPALPAPRSRQPAAAILPWPAPRRPAAAGPHPSGKLSSCPAPTSCRNHASRSFWPASAVTGDRARPGRADHASPPNSRRKAGITPVRRSPASARRWEGRSNTCTGRSGR
jgi:hypothetical protein